MKKFLLRLLVSLSSLTVTLLSAEIAIRVFNLFHADRSVFDVPLAQSALTSELSAETPPSDNTRRRILIHPFLGWSVRPSPGDSRFLRTREFFPDQNPSGWAIDNLPINVFGYRSYIQDYRSVGPNQVTIGVFGGSVASQMCLFAGDVLRNRFADGLGVDLDSVSVLNFGGGGYKQPQQLVALAEMATLGLEFDFIINLDGFNEIVFGPRDAKKQHNPIFPSRQHWLSSLAMNTTTLSEQQILLASDVITEKNAQERIEAAVRGLPMLVRSELVKAFAGARIRRHHSLAVSYEKEFQALSEDRANEVSVVTLPDTCFNELDSCLNRSGELWRNASIAMNRFSQQSGTRYIHVLQPNQYVPASKRLTPFEQEFAYTQGIVFEQYVPAGYLILQEYASDLRRNGVRFLDLSLIFQNVDETIYVDDCCHMNYKGYSAIAQEISDFVLSDMNSPIPRDGGGTR